jgi:hypothetical protein
VRVQGHPQESKTFATQAEAKRWAQRREDEIRSGRAVDAKLTRRTLKEWVKAHVPCFCWAHGNIIEDAIETARNYAHEAPGLLFGAYRRQVAIMRQRKLHNAALNRTDKA